LAAAEIVNQSAACIVRVALLEAFDYGDDAVLAAMNDRGLDALLQALSQAREHGSATLHCDGRTHTFAVEIGAADIQLHDGCDDLVHWQLNPATILEMIEMLTVMKGHGLCHNYVDIVTPATTLVLSVDEYLVPNAVVHTSPFGYF
jgi:hypothetical protein